MQKMGWLGGIQGHRQCHHSIECIQLPTLPCEISAFKNRQAEGVSAAKYHVRDFTTQKTVSKYLSDEISSI